MKKVSIIIPTRNLNSSVRPFYIVDTLKSLRGNTKYPNYEVIIVDNGSSKSAKIYLKKFLLDDDIYIIINEADVNNACNLGITKSSGEILCVIDDDAEFKSGWLELGVFLLEQLSKSEDILAVSLYNHERNPYSKKGVPIFNYDCRLIFFTTDMYGLMFICFKEEIMKLYPFPKRAGKETGKDAYLTKYAKTLNKKLFVTTLYSMVQHIGRKSWAGHRVLISSPKTLYQNGVAIGWGFDRDEFTDKERSKFDFKNWEKK